MSTSRRPSSTTALDDTRLHSTAQFARLPHANDIQRSTWYLNRACLLVAQSLHPPLSVHRPSGNLARAVQADPLPRTPGDEVPPSIP